jgi:hypothetical protein
MKRILVLLLALSLLLVGCNGGDDAVTGHEFSQDADGYGVTDTVTGIHYVALDLAFEPAVTSAVVGTYTNGAFTRTFYQIKDLDPALYVADNELGVWYAGEGKPDPKALTVTAILVCEQTAFSRELFRYAAGEGDLMIAAIKGLWFDGESTDFPESDVQKKRSLKMSFAELPNLFYCFDFGVFEEGAFFFDRMSGRAVAVPDALATELQK